MHSISSVRRSDREELGRVYSRAKEQELQRQRAGKNAMECYAGT